MARNNSLLSYLDKTLPSKAFIAFKNFFSFLPFVSRVDNQIINLRSHVNMAKSSKDNVQYLHYYQQNNTFFEAKYPGNTALFSYSAQENSVLNPPIRITSTAPNPLVELSRGPSPVSPEPKVPEIIKKWTMPELQTINKCYEDDKIEEKISALYQNLANDPIQINLLVDDFIAIMQKNPHDSRTALGLAYLIEINNQQHADVQDTLTISFEQLKTKFKGSSSFDTVLTASQSIIINKLIAAINTAPIGTAYQQELRGMSRRLCQSNGASTRGELIQNLDNRVTFFISKTAPQSRSTFDRIIKCLSQLKSIFGLGEDNTVAKAIEAEKLVAEERAFNDALDQRLQESGAAVLERESYRHC